MRTTIKTINKGIPIFLVIFFIFFCLINEAKINQSIKPKIQNHSSFCSTEKNSFSILEASSFAIASLHL
jgi:hypothetical protein